MTNAELCELLALDRTLATGRHRVRTLDKRLTKMQEIVREADAQFRAVTIWESEDARMTRAGNLYAAERMIECRYAALSKILMHPWPSLNCVVDVRVG